MGIRGVVTKVAAEFRSKTCINIFDIDNMGHETEFLKWVDQNSFILPIEIDENINVPHTKGLGFPTHSRLNGFGQLGTVMLKSWSAVLEWPFRHELLHVIGFDHTLARHDATTYYTKYVDQCSPSELGQIETSVYPDYGEVFDFASILLYRETVTKGCMKLTEAGDKAFKSFGDDKKKSGRDRVKSARYCLGQCALRLPFCDY